MAPLGATDGASSITVVVRVRPFTIREAAQLQKTDDGPLFLGEGSLAGVPAPRVGGKGIRSVIKVVDERCLYALSYLKYTTSQVSRLTGPQYL